MAPTDRRAKSNHEESCKYAKNWWKLKLSDRNSHNEAMKIHLLSPFLYRKISQSEEWIEWAKSAELLTGNRSMELSPLAIDEIQHTDLMELVMLRLQEQIQTEFNNKKSVKNNTFEGVIKNMEEFEKEKSLAVVISKLKDKHWFKTIKTDVLETKMINKQIQEKCDAAIVLAAWQISYYVREIFRKNNLLKDYQENREFDVEAERNKEKGNKFFKDGKYERAINTYTNILCNKPYLYVVYGNRAFCFLKMRNYWPALADGRRCTTLNPKWFKGQNRFAEALFELGFSDTALRVLEQAKEICDDNGPVISYMNEIKKKIEKNRRVPRHIDSDPDYESCSDSSDFEEVSSHEDLPSDLPDLVDATDESDSNDEEFDVYGTKKNPSKGLEAPYKLKKPLPSYMVGNFMGDDSNEILIKKRAEEKAEKERHMQLSRLENLRRRYKYVVERASHSLLKTKGFKFDPMKEYKSAINLVLSEANLLDAKEHAVLLYAHADTYLRTDIICNVNKSIKMFTEINKKFNKDIAFPLPYLAIAKAHLKQKQFKRIKEFCEQAKSLSGKPGCFSNCVWPGTNITIEESVPKKLKSCIGEMLKIAAKPPDPDAICYFGSCTYENDKIYFDELEFQGFIRIQCDNRHFVEYHVKCWNKCSPFAGSSPVKGVRRPCLKSQCDGFIVVIEKHYSYEMDPTIEYKDETLSSIYYLHDDTPEQSPKPKKKKKKNSAGNNNTPAITEITSEEVKNEENKENSIPAPKSKKKKKKNKSSPDLARRNEICLKYDASTASFDFNQFTDFFENPKLETYKIYSFVEELLTDHKEPFILLRNNKKLLKYQNNFSTNLKSYVEKVGGLYTLLSKCGTFSFDEKQTNVLYLTEREDEYKDYKREKETLLSSQAPKCEDALFTETTLKKNCMSSDIPDVVKNTKLNDRTSAKPKIEEVNGYFLNGEENGDEDNDEPQTCVVDAKLQVDTLDSGEIRKLSMEVKILRQENEKLQESIRSKKEENEAAIQQIMYKNRTLERDADKMKQNYEIASAKMKDYENASAKMKQDQEANQKEFNKLTKKFNSQATLIQKEFKAQLAQTQTDHEEIVQGLTNSIMDESKRAQKAELALLEARRDLVVIKYQQQANVIQNTINRMQFLPQVPEMIRMRKIWEDYKLEYQSAFEKMQEEFSGFIQSVKQGQRLDILPTAIYSHPPSYPQEVFPSANLNGPLGQTSPVPPPLIGPNGVPPRLPRPVGAPPIQPLSSQAMFMPPNAAAVPVLHNIHGPNIPFNQQPLPPSQQLQQQQPKETNWSAVVENSKEIKVTTDGIADSVNFTASEDIVQSDGAQAVYTTQPQQQQQHQHSDSEDSEASNRSGETDDIKMNKFAEKIVLKLGSKFPTSPRDELIYYFNEYRKQGPLSGQKIDDIVAIVERLMKRQKAMRTETIKIQQQSSTRGSTPEKKKQSRVQGSGALGHGVARSRSRANQVPSKSGNNVFGTEEPCVICYDEMQSQNSLLLHCGHTFHKECIHCWLKEQRTCPVCRVLALLPEEYPALG